jgi:uncharacterized protein (DUF302 family)
MKRLSAILLGLILSAPAMHGVLAETSPGDPTGLVTVESAHDVPTTVERLVTAAEAKGLTVFARIDHAAGAEQVGMELPPTQLVIFGTAKVGTPLMQCDRTVGIDLPLKALIWEDADGKVLLGYNASAWLASRHDLEDCAPALAKIGDALAALASEATANQ